MTHTNTPIQHNIHTAYTSQQKTNLLADFYKQLSTPAILLQEQHNTIIKQINQLSSAHNTDTILKDPITTSDIQETIQNQKDTTPGSAGIKNQKDTTPSSAGIKNQTDTTPGSVGIKNQKDTTPGSAGIKNQKDTTPGSAGIKNQKDTTPGSAGIKNHKDTTPGSAGIKNHT
jgi:hypothetical protein